MSTYQFKHHDPYQYENATPHELKRLEWIDRLLADTMVDHEPRDLEAMTDEQLQHLVSLLPGQRKPASPVSDDVDTPAPPRADLGPRILVHGFAPVRRERCPFPAPIKHKASIWYQGRSHDLGWYLTEQVRDEVVSEAKMLRSMGLDPRLAKRKK